MPRVAASGLSEFSYFWWSKLARCRGWRHPGCLSLCIVWSNLARCRRWRPPGCLMCCIFGGPNWLDAEGGGPRAVGVLVCLVIFGGPIWLDAEGGAPGLSDVWYFWWSKLARCRGWRPPGCLMFGILGGPIWLDAVGGGPRAVSCLVFLVVQIG